MGLLRRFGSRNHPQAREMQRARAGMAVSPETVAAYRAARGFLLAEWFGASLMVASFTLLYLLTFASMASVAATLLACVGMLLAGSYVFWTNRRNYARIGFPWAKRWDTAALVVAGSGAVFWFMFLVLELLTLFGVAAGPA